MYYALVIIRTWESAVNVFLTPSFTGKLCKEVQKMFVPLFNRALIRCLLVVSWSKNNVTNIKKVEVAIPPAAVSIELTYPTANPSFL